MKNLCVVEERSHAYSVGDVCGGLSEDGSFGEDKTDANYLLSVNGITDHVFVCARGTARVSCLTCREAGRVLWSVDARNGCLHSGNDTVSSFCLSPELDALCIGMSSGELVLVYLPDTLEDGGSVRVETVGEIEGGIAAAVWSPDGEYYAVVGSLGQFLLMNSQWDVLMEACVCSVECSDPQPTAYPEPDALDACSRGDYKDYFRNNQLTCRDVEVSWRGDCRYVATCSRVSPGGAGRIRVWDVESQKLHSIGEQSPGTIPVISWQPNGRVLCVANDLDEDQVEEVSQLRQITHEQGAQGQAPEVKHIGAWKRELKRREEASKARGDIMARSRVFLYERNGLQHGEFMLPGQGRVQYMEWSPNSEMLVIIVKEQNKEISYVYSVQVWCRSNWKWYMKFARTFPEMVGATAAWQESDNGTYLCVMTSQCSLSRIRFSWSYTNNSIYGTVAVVDGSLIGLTPLRHTMMPPPLCALNIDCSMPVVSVSFNRMGSNESIGALLCDGSVAVMVCEDEDNWESMLEDTQGADEIPTVAVVWPTLFKAHSIHHDQINTNFRSICWSGSDYIVLIGQDLHGRDVVNTFKLDLLSMAMHPHSSIVSSGHILACCSSIAFSKFICERDDGSCYEHDIDGNLNKMACKFEAPCEVISCASVHPEQDALIGLDRKNRLYINSKMIANSVSSFVIHHSSAGGPHVLYTLKSHVIRTLPLALLVSKGVPPIRAGDITIRSIEEGSLLVACPRHGVDVVLQAPRGNLEIIRPRALVLPAIASALDAGNYRKAWSLATVNRLDLNILADYQWPLILDKVGSFMESIGSDSEVAGFLQALQPSNILAKDGQYSSVLGESDLCDIQGKISSICESVRAYVEETTKSDCRRWLLTELTSYTKDNRIGAALARIKSIREEELQIQDTQKGIHNTSSSAEAGLKHMLLYTQEEQVYRAALGEYELEMAYMVITYSQRDPGEYLLDLQRFADIQNKHLRFAAIDKYLERYDKAVFHTFHAGDEYFSDALSLASSHGLLRLLLSLTHEKGCRKRVQIALAEQLSSQSKYEDAALCYAAADDLEQALRCYRLAGAWRPAMMLAMRLGKDSDSIRSMAARLAQDLEDGHNFEEAARIHYEYLHDIKKCIHLLTQAGSWREALRLSISESQHYSLNQIVIPSAAETSERILDGLQDDIERVDKYWGRLKELREKRQMLETLKREADEEARASMLLDEADDDIRTEAASAVSEFSMYTDASLATSMSTVSFASTIGGRKGVQGSKNQKKQKKGKKKIRRGSPEEEAQLAGYILSLVPLPSLCLEIGQLSELLVLVGHEDDAAILQSTLKRLIDTQGEASADILKNPPPGESLDLPDALRQVVFDTAGIKGLSTLEQAATNTPSPSLQVKVQEAESSMKNVTWKWELLRDP